MATKEASLPGPSDRAAALKARRQRKMARSAHAYVRGNTKNFYDWLEGNTGEAVPAGPAIWICGDCHAGNIGPIASAKGTVSIQIRDLDQTVVGNPAHDLIRLGLSMASAARGSDLPGVTTARMMEQIVEGYEQSFGAVADADDEWPEVVQQAMKAALKRGWKDLARERIEDTKPTIPLGRTFWPLAPEEREAIDALFATDAGHRLVTALRSRPDDAEIEVVDAAYWVKGCSSLGLLRCAVLVAVGGKKGEVCLVDIKEAVPALAPRAAEAEMPVDHGERVVAGAWHLSPALGDRMLAAKLLDRPVFVRELLPQDLKFDVACLTCEEAMRLARFLATVVGKAHARQMDEPTRKSWQEVLGQHRSKTLDAPSWLWASVVDLLATHEKAYLEHCRRYASESAGA
ncbi:MAG: DUF2252 domain-containing protein [Planctomycetia bacterium]|nr:DUF2252 domain-containing protein [Planctomycetia bacterium]